MGNGDARFLLLAAICLGLTFSWVPPCLIAFGLGHPLHPAVFISWSLFIASLDQARRKRMTTLAEVRSLIGLMPWSRQYS